MCNGIKTRIDCLKNGTLALGFQKYDSQSLHRKNIAQIRLVSYQQYRYNTSKSTHILQGNIFIRKWKKKKKDRAIQNR